MKKLTQTRGNCWQTCVAMLLEVAPESMPEQPESEDALDFEKYVEIVRAYLHKHHGLTYAEVDPYKAVPPQGLHIIMGDTVRDAERTHHAIIGLSGKPLWDVHPTRAGLTTMLRWGVLIPYTLAPVQWRQDFERRSISCTCSACQPTTSVESSSESRVVDGPSS